MTDAKVAWAFIFFGILWSTNAIVSGKYAFGFGETAVALLFISGILFSILGVYIILKRKDDN